MKSLLLTLRLALVLFASLSVSPLAFGTLLKGTFIISESDLAPVMARVPVFAGTRSFYLWWADTERYSASAIRLSFHGDFEIVDVIPKQGLVNAGTKSSPLLVFPSGGCLVGSNNILLAEIVISDSLGTGGLLCLGESSMSDRTCFQDCNLKWWSPKWIGPTIGGRTCSGGLVSEAGCQPVPTARASWGLLKSRYK